MINIDIPLQIFPSLVAVYIGGDKNEVYEDLKHYKPFQYNYFEENFIISDKVGLTLCMENLIVIWFKDDLDLRRDAGLIAHESLHAACFALDYIGMRFSEETEELYAHLVDYIVNKIAEKVTLDDTHRVN